MIIKHITSAMCIALLSGCLTQQIPIVEPTKQWEDHYMTTEAFYEGTKNMQLSDGESVWVLSNKTLARLLKNTGLKTVQKNSNDIEQDK